MAFLSKCVGFLATPSLRFFVLSLSDSVVNHDVNAESGASMKIKVRPPPVLPEGRRK